MAIQDYVTLRVVLALSSMYVAVHLDYQTHCMTVEIGDEPCDDLLATERISYCAEAPESVPEHAFFRRHLLS